VHGAEPEILILDPGVQNLGYLRLTHTGMPVGWGNVSLLTGLVPQPHHFALKHVSEGVIAFADREDVVTPYVTHVLIEFQYRGTFLMHRVEAALDTIFRARGLAVWVYQPSALKRGLRIACGEWEKNKCAVAGIAEKIIDAVANVWPARGKEMQALYALPWCECGRKREIRHNLADPLACYYALYFTHSLHPPANFFPGPIPELLPLPGSSSLSPPPSFSPFSSSYAVAPFVDGLSPLEIQPSKS